MKFHFLKKNKFLLPAWMLVVLLLPPGMAMTQATLSGRVTNPAGEALQGANIWLKKTKTGTSTDANGLFTIDGLEPGDYHLRLSYVGYEMLELDISLAAGDNFFELQMEQAGITLGALLVSSTRVEKEAPFTHTNLNKETIESRNLGQDVPFLLRYTPSAVVTSDAGTGIGYTGIRIRGSDPSRINVTINGIPLNDAESQQVFWVDLPDFASSANSIQIQRGVGTSTNGAGAFGATIKVNTSDVQREPFVAFKGSMGSFGTRKGKLQFGSGLLGDRFTIDGRISRVFGGGYVDRASADLWSWYGSAAFIGKKTTVRTNIFSGHEITYQAWCGLPWQLRNSNRTFNPCGLKTDGTFYENQVDDYRQSHYQVLLNHQFNPTLYGNVALHYTRGKGFFEEWRNMDPLSRYGLSEVTRPHDTISEADLVRRRWLDNHFYGSIFSLNYQPQNTSFNTALGGGWHRYDGRHFGEVIHTDISEIPTPLPPYYDNDAIKTDWNIYSKTSFDLTEKIKTYLDVQYRMVDYEFLGFDEDGSNVTQDVTLHFFNPKAGLTYLFSTRSHAYASFAVGSREPNRDDYVESSPASRPDPEKLYNTEIGFRQNWNHAALDINFYQMYYRDQLALTGALNDVGAYTRINVPHSYRIGIELNGGLRIWQGMRLDGNATFSQNKIAEFEEFIDNWDTGEQEKIIHENTDLAFSPNLIATGILSYEFFRARPRRSLQLEWITKYVGSQYIDNTSNPDARLDAYAFSDFQLSYEWQATFGAEFALTLLIQNIWDSQFSTNAWVYRFISAGYDPRPDDPFARSEQANTYNLTGLYPQAGRSFLLGLSVKI